MDITTHHTGRRSGHRRVAVLAGLTLLAPVVITTSTARAADETPPSPHAELLAAPDPGATSSLPTPPGTVRSRLAEVALPPSAFTPGLRVEFNLFDRVTLLGTVDAASPGASATVWTGTLADGGTFEAVEVADAQRISIHSSGGEFGVINDTDDSAALVVEYDDSPAAPVDRGGHDEASSGDASADRLTQQPTTALTSDLADQSAANTPSEAGNAAGTEGTEGSEGSAADGHPLARRAQPVLVPPLRWSSQRGYISYRAMRGLKFPLPRGDRADHVTEWVQFTPEAYAALGGTESQARAIAETQVSRINQVLTNSQMQVRVKLARVSVQTPAQRGTTVLSEYYAIGQRDGYLDGINGTRRKAKIDHISQIVLRSSSDPDCGRGTPGGTDQLSLTVLGHDCLEGASSLAYAHEFGHNFSAQHDRQASSAPPSGSYAFGYVDPQQRFRTVMSYPTACPPPNCQWLPQFSSATLQYNYGGTLLPTGNATTDNRRAAVAYQRRLVNVSPTKVYGGQIAVLGSSRRLYAVAGYGLPWAAKRSYRWYVNNRLVGRKRTFTPTRSMNRKKVRVVVSFTSPGYRKARKVSPTWRILRVRGTRYSGRPKVGHVLRVRSGRKVLRGQRMSVVWKRGTTTVGRRTSYRLTRADAGRDVYAIVTYRARGAVGDVEGARWSGIRR